MKVGQNGATSATGGMAVGLLAAVCFGHFLNDGIGSIIPAALPILRDAHGLTSLPCLTLFQKVSRLQPSGFTVPIPVMTTRFIKNPFFDSDAVKL